MIQSILRIIFKGVLITTAVTIFMVIFGPYIGFVIYHLNFSVYFVTQKFLEPGTIKYIMLAFFIIMIVKIFKKIQSVIS